MATTTKKSKLQQAYSNKGGDSDERYTPCYVVEKIKAYIPKDKICWCPFDTKDSNFVKELSKTHTVVHSHISTGQDFFKYQPEKWDIIVSNPPFTGKRKFVERALSLNKPFALLLPCTWLNDSAPSQLFADKKLQLLMFGKRIKFLDTEYNEIKGAVPFSCAFYCIGILPEQIIWG